MSTNNKLVPNRECGECSVCCISLRIEQNDLKKAADVRCHNLSENGCGIYTERPSVCRNWYCGWRMIPSLGNEWRPDKSQILIKLSGNSMVLQPLKSEHAKKLLDEAALTFIAKLMNAGFMVETSIPTKPGYCNSLMTINDKLEKAVNERDLNAARSTMKAVIFRSRNSNTLPDPPFDDL